MLNINDEHQWNVYSYSRQTSMADTLANDNAEKEPIDDATGK